MQAADRIFETKGLDMGDSAKEKQVDYTLKAVDPFE
jgi:hypothetical protein